MIKGIKASRDTSGLLHIKVNNAMKINANGKIIMKCMTPAKLEAAHVLLLNRFPFS
jgi:hypothetical protein